MLSICNWICIIFFYH